MKTYVSSYTQTVSQNYQSRRHEFGFEVDMKGSKGDFSKVKRAQQLCEAVVRNALDVKIGLRRRDLDDLADEFFGVNWDEMASGVRRKDEVL